ncbi:hemerythrin domain-containing protein [Silvimonas sp. JCM 19000]
MATAASSHKAPRKSTSQRAAPGSKSDAATNLLIADHRKVKALFRQFEKIKDSDDLAEKERIVREACMELTMHTQIEEEIFYPASRQILGDDDEIDESLVEHASCKELIAQLEAMHAGDDMYDARFTVLSEMIEHHVEEEEGEWFPEVRAKGREQMPELAQQMAARKEELMANVPSKQ